MLTPETVAHTAHLAGLSLDTTRAEQIRQDLDQILAWVAVLQDLDTAHVEPLVFPTEVLDAWAEDKAQAGFTTEQALHNAPATHGQYFTVQKVM